MIKPEQNEDALILEIEELRHQLAKNLRQLDRIKAGRQEMFRKKFFEFADKADEERKKKLIDQMEDWF